MMLHIVSWNKREGFTLSICQNLKLERRKWQVSNTRSFLHLALTLSQTENHTAALAIFTTPTKVFTKKATDNLKRLNMVHVQNNRLHCESFITLLNSFFSFGTTWDPRDIILWTSMNYFALKREQAEQHPKTGLQGSRFSDKSGPATPSTMPVICSVEFVHQLIHCTA